MELKRVIPSRMSQPAWQMLGPPAEIERECVQIVQRRPSFRESPVVANVHLLSDDATKRHAGRQVHFGARACADYEEGGTVEHWSWLVPDGQ